MDDNLLERLIDFEKHGRTAIERFVMRKDAYDEIRMLRHRVAELESIIRNGR